MTTTTIVPLGLHVETRTPLTAAWGRLLLTSGWQALSRARARAELLRRADELEASQPSLASDLRSAATNQG